MSLSLVHCELLQTTFANKMIRDVGASEYENVYQLEMFLMKTECHR